MTEGSADRFAHRALIAQHNVRFGEIEPDAEDGHDQKNHEQSNELHCGQEQFVGALRGFALQHAMQSKQCDGRDCHHNAGNQQEPDIPPQIPAAGAEEILAGQAVGRGISLKNPAEKQSGREQEE